MAAIVYRISYNLKNGVIEIINVTENFDDDDDDYIFSDDDYDDPVPKRKYSKKKKSHITTVAIPDGSASKISRSDELKIRRQES